MSNDNNTDIEIKKFYLADIFEKYQAIKNELDNLLQILNFYAPLTELQKLSFINTKKKLTLKDFQYHYNKFCKNNNCLGFKDSCNLMKSDISKIKNELDKGYKDIYKNINNINNTNEAFIRIVYYDKFRVLTTNILKALESIGRKLFQLLEDDLNQYIPYPKHNKRFSSKALTEFLQTEYNNIYQKFNKDNLKILLYWGYREYFKIKNHKNRENQYIRLSFYHHEISSTLPILAHEVFHLVIKNSDQNSEVIQLKNTIQEELSKNSIVINFLSDIESLAEEVVCDFYAYLVHKESYILSLYQEILGIGFYDKFVVSNKEKEPINIMYVNLTDGDESKLINSIIRLLVLSNYYFEYTKNGNEELNKYIQILYKEIENMSNYLIQSYKISSHLNKDADYFFKSIDKTEDIILEKLNNKNATVKDNNITKVYQEFWKIRLNYIKDNKVPYKGYIRYLILKDTLGLSDDEDRYHLLTMYKYRFGEDNKNFLDFIKDKDKNKDEEKDKDFAFGIYNACKLIERNAEESFKKEEKEKEEKNKEFFFYTRKYPLIKISKKDNSSNKEDNGGNVLFNLFMFVEIYNSCSLDAIKNSYEYIKDYLDEKTNIKNYTIFKSLGPMDFLIYIEKIDIKNLWKIKEHFIKKNESEHIKRTHTIISCQLPSENIELPEEFIFKTTLRIKTDAKDWEDKLFKLKNSNGGELKFKSYLTPGVQDVDIVWDYINLNDLEKIYEQLDEFCTDIQTKIVKVLKKRTR